MDAEYYAECISKKNQPTTQHLISYLGIGVLAIIISLGLTTKANAIYLMSDFARAGTYIDKGRYYFLDYGQYYFLDKGQYHLIGKLDNYLGHHLHPSLYEKSMIQEIRFSNNLNEALFIFLAEKFPVSDYSQQTNYCFNAGKAIYRQRYYFPDMLKYNYLDEGQYNLLGKLAHSSGYPNYQKHFAGITYTSNLSPNPEPSTIVFLALGAVGIIAFRKNKSIK